MNIAPVNNIANVGNVLWPESVPKGLWCKLNIDDESIINLIKLVKCIINEGSH